MSDVSLTDIIQESLAAEDPQVADNPTEATETEVDDSEVTIEDLINGVDEAEEDTEAETEGDEAENDDNPEAETYQVKVDGEVVEVTLKEALAGYQRQADYTRKAQALAAEKAEFEQATVEFTETLNTLQELDQAWEDDPIDVISRFTANTGNPTRAVAQLIQRLATAGMLERDFMDMFGITPAQQEEWAKAAEVDSLRRKVSQTETEKDKKLQEAEFEAEVQKAMAEYESQIDDILSAEGLDLTVSQRNAFRSKLAKYAADNDLTNLKAAYKALKYEEGQKKKQIAAKTAERAKQKKNASVVGRSGAGSSGAAPVTDSTDLSAIIKAAMNEASAGRS